MKPAEQSKLLPVIAGFKLVKACGLFIVALGLHRLLRDDQAEVLAHWSRVVRVDPENGVLHTLIHKLTGLSHGRLEELSVATFFYGTMFATEGIGLLLRKRWAEYFTTLMTALLMPLEVYEVIRRVTVLKVVVLMANIAIIVVLIKLLLRRREPSG